MSDARVNAAPTSKDGDPIDPSTPKPDQVDPGEGTTEEGTPVENPSG